MRSGSEWVKRDDQQEIVSARKATVDVTTLLRRGLALHKADRLADAELVYEEVLAISPKNFDARRLLGLIRYQQGAYQDAIRQIDSALEINPESASAHVIRGNALYALTHFTEAVKSYDRAIALDKGDQEAVANRIRAIHELERLAHGVYVVKLDGSKA